MGFDTLDIFSHRNPQKAHPWVKPRRLKIRPPVFAVGDDKKKREGNVTHNVGLYFSYMGSGPHWTYFNEN